MQLVIMIYSLPIDYNQSIILPKGHDQVEEEHLAQVFPTGEHVEEQHLEEVALLIEECWVELYWVEVFP